ncbi:sigma-70 family RNA polymerase sigma factor [Paenibacillus ginsengarvi]|uniref:Sigma-70 family RNA polymerase sigma factor n=1 Tax=Paenibacillus ginsengarvi TaxID=400777 RepID=A0A3B0BH01_9BACL|nr:sigma-70 family RNA polymerase sigma factor [Paenibacillus ginsengarvi]RKN71257.1 sigma-70 family RNA polymerase sigma factor [Paenibacillus ginsengarvi]
MSTNPVWPSPNDSVAGIIEYQRNPTDDLATELIRQYEPMVKMAAGKMARSRPDLYEDLLQVGHMALLRLFDQFDAGKGSPFEPYAMKSIIGHMKNFLRDKSWYIQVPRRIKEKGASLRQAIDELTVRLERSPNVEEIAGHLGLSYEETMEVFAGRELYHYVSLDTPVSEEDSASTLGDMIGAPNEDYDSIVERMDLIEAMDKLKPEERQVLSLVFEQGLSQRVIAAELSVSQMSVSRILKRATAKLKTLLVEDEP